MPESSPAPCDATIVLASESNINRKAMNKTHDSLAAVGANVIGVVLNGGMAACAAAAGAGEHRCFPTCADAHPRTGFRARASHHAPNAS